MQELSGAGEHARMLGSDLGSHIANAPHGSHADSLQGHGQHSHDLHTPLEVEHQGSVLSSVADLTQQQQQQQQQAADSQQSGVLSSASPFIVDKEKFDAAVLQKLGSTEDPTGSKKRSVYTIRRADESRISNVLKTKFREMSGEGSAQYRHWVRTHFYLSSDGNKDHLYHMRSKKRICFVEDYYEALYNAHLATGHGGQTRTAKAVHDSCHGIPQWAVNIFCSMCSTCSLRKDKIQDPTIKRRIVAVGFLTRVNVDVVDLSDFADGTYIAVLHVRDHFSKFTWAYPLANKEATLVAAHLAQLFFQFGSPLILHCPPYANMATLVVDRMREFQPNVRMVRGRTDILDCELTMMVQSSQLLRERIGKWCQLHKRHDWSKGLPYVVHTINTTVSPVTKLSPYEVVFGQRANLATAEILHWLDGLKGTYVVGEEELPLDVQQRIAEVTSAHGVVVDLEMDKQKDECDVVHDDEDDEDDEDEHKLARKRRFEAHPDMDRSPAKKMSKPKA
mmetsp:Transcript_40841/g.102814  ORF Transcript_40841/g.102814 Transcript_40841/m.102814 type:complete len:505 (+) Transcript_40841:260-1774(+)|eukprot:CAMPEP_0177645848 /NCGR_PEP_ID=MMETSP0447-20121125/9465_1 /TAXON_ID=0 /ORGANISM="Stygamoeba regulata, Strain BSH-02190019" /LENGTH=504 /DNA_ID=CAMNT_0019148353 /DNA_START=204 /DNA_END=1718 /DNA_ORIENTATION=-